MAKGFNRGGGMPNNMSNLMKQAAKMREDLEKTQENIANENFTASSGGGAVTATVSGSGNIVDLKISQEVLDDADMVADLVITAVNQALADMQSKKDDMLGGLTGGLDNFGGLF